MSHQGALSTGKLLECFYPNVNKLKRFIYYSYVLQIHAECKRFGKVYSLRSVAVYGGGSMWEQAKALQEGAEIVVCTPVRNLTCLFFLLLTSKCINENFTE